MKSLLLTAIISTSALLSAEKIFAETPPQKGALVWSDEFDYTDKELDKRWRSQNGPSGHIMCSRWRENAVASDGTLKLINRKEVRAGQQWTSGNIWTYETFKYGYFECRYKYSAATATNNSFWLMSDWSDKTPPKEGARFEIDINEGHYPNKVNTNIHNWSETITRPDGTKTHPSSSKSFNFGTKHDNTIQLEIPIAAKRIRLSSKGGNHVHLREFRIYNVNAGGYPQIMSETADSDLSGLINLSKDPTTKITSSGRLSDKYPLENIIDGEIASSWVTQTEGDKWVEFEFAEHKTVGCIQFINGWLDNGTWNGILSNYKLEYMNTQGEWVEISVLNVEKEFNFANEFHVYGLDWSCEWLIFYVDGKEIRREKNTFCYSAVPIWLSLAIIKWGGPVTDAIDGTQMEVDYVRVYQKKE